MPIMFDRSICCDFDQTTSREWLVTNSIGGYAAGTVSGMLTRMEHGLLVAALPTLDTPQLLLAKIDEEVVFDQRTYYLGTNEYRDGTLNPAGFVHLETFRLEEGFPIFTYRLGGLNGMMLEKRIWMERERNTTCIQYRLLSTMPPNGVKLGYGYGRGGATDAPYQSSSRYYEYAEKEQRSLQLTLLPFTAFRPYNELCRGREDWHFEIQKHRVDDDQPNNTRHSSGIQLRQEGVAGCTIKAWPQAHPYHIFAVGHPESNVTFLPTGVWYWNFLRRHNAAAGLPSTDDLYLPGVIRATLWPGDDASLTIIVSAEELSSLTLQRDSLRKSYERNSELQRELVEVAMYPSRFFGEGGESVRAERLRALPMASTSRAMGADEYIRILLQGADRFIAWRSIPRTHIHTSALLLGQSEHTTLIFSNYYSLLTRTRDALIALPGLLLTTGRYDEASHFLRSIARHFKQGLLPDTLPPLGVTVPETSYGNVDATLWFCYTLDHYLRATHDYKLLEELYHRLADCIEWYMKGTYHNIHMTSDGLLHAASERRALTWMDAVVDGSPVTPRLGKPVEVNALWYHALTLMHEWTEALYQQKRINYCSSFYKEQAARCAQHFRERFWYADRKYLFDVVDGPEGDDNALRPNQLLACSLRRELLDEEMRQCVLKAVTQHLYTPYGLRSLAPSDPSYHGSLIENYAEMRRALHQGPAWGWLLGAYLDAQLSLSSEDRGAQGKRSWQSALRILESFQEHLNQGILGLSAGVFDGNPPYLPVEEIASAAATGEILRIYSQLSHKLSQQFSEYVTGRL